MRALQINAMGLSLFSSEICSVPHTITPQDRDAAAAHEFVLSNANSISKLVTSSLHAFTSSLIPKKRYAHARTPLVSLVCEKVVCVGRNLSRLLQILGRQLDVHFSVEQLRAVFRCKLRRRACCTAQQPPFGGVDHEQDGHLQRPTKQK